MRSISVTSLFFVHSRATSPATEPWPSANLDVLEYPNVVVIPFVHGDFDAALQSMYMAYKDVTMPTMDHHILTPIPDIFLRYLMRSCLTMPTLDE
jgi:hypothetical protein